MKPVWAKPWQSHEVQQAMEWLAENQGNGYEPEVIRYPATLVYKAERNDRPILYQCFQNVVMVDALGVAPDASPLDIAAGLQEVVKAAIWEGRKAGHGQIFMRCSKQETEEFARKHGFEESAYPVYRMKIL